MKTLVLLATCKLTEKEYMKFVKDGRKLRVPENDVAVLEINGRSKPVRLAGGAIAEEAEILRAALVLYKPRS